MEEHDLDIVLVQLQDGRDAVRLEAVRALLKNPHRLARKGLIQALGDSNSDVRCLALHALEPFLDISIQKEILALFQDSSRVVRTTAVRLVGKKASVASFSPLLEMLGDSDADVRALAALGLSRFSEKFIPQLLDEFTSSQWLKRSQVFETLLLMGQKTHDSIRRALGRRELPREKCYWLVKLVGEFRLMDQFQPVVSLLEEAREAQDEELLEVAVEAMGKLGNSDSIPTLAGLLDHPSERVREACIQGLSSLGEFALTHLLERLDDDSRMIRVSSATGLARIGDGSLAPLLENFYEKDREGRFWILNALKKLNHPVVQSIFQTLCYDEDADLQVVSIGALSQFPSDDATQEILLDLLAHGQWKVRNEAANTLSRLREVPDEFFINQLQVALGDTRYWLVRVMERIASPGFAPALLTLLSSEDWVLKNAVSDALKALRGAQVELFLEFLSQGTENEKYWISKALCGSTDACFFEPMLALLGSTQTGLRDNAKEFFVLAGEKGIPFLRDVLTQRHPRQIYQWVIEILGEMGDQSLALILDLLASASKEEVYWGSVLAGTLGEGALPKLHELLEASDWRVRCNAILGVERIGSCTSVPHLLELLEDEYFSIRKMAVACLGKIGSQEAESRLLELLDSDDLELRLKVLEALGLIGGADSAPYVLKGLQDANWLIQRQSLRSLGLLKDSGSITALLEFSKSLPSDLDEDFLLAVKGLSSPRFLNYLLERARTGTVSALKLVIPALGELENLDAGPVLLPFLEHENWDVRRVAVDALGSQGLKEAIPALKELLADADPILRVHVKNTLREILGPKLWEKLLGEFVQNSRHEQSRRFFQQAQDQARLQEWKKVLSTLRKANALSETISTLSLMARAHAECKDYAKAETCYLKVLKQRPEHIKAIYNLAMLAFVQQDHERVESLFKRLESQPELSQSLVDMIQKTRERIAERLADSE
jgi:HEAT repeat protein